MTVLQAIFLAVVQGVTEFLPISSSGHLVFFQHLFSTGEIPVFFDIALHVGTLVAVFFFFRYDLYRICTKERKILFLLLVGTIPAGLVGIFFQSYLESLFSVPSLLGIFFIVNTLILFVTKWFPVGKKEMNQISILDACVIGCFQAAAIIPALSRSGATIVGALGRGLQPEAAFRFSFLLSIPAIVGAFVLQIKDISSLSQDVMMLSTLGAVIAGLVGYVSLILLQRVLQSRRLALFGWYTLFIGIVSFFLFNLS